MVSYVLLKNQKGLEPSFFYYYNFFVCIYVYFCRIEANSFTCVLYTNKYIKYAFVRENVSISAINFASI